MKIKIRGEIMSETKKMGTKSIVGIAIAGMIAIGVFIAGINSYSYQHKELYREPEEVYATVTRGDETLEITYEEVDKRIESLIDSMIEQEGEDYLKNQYYVNLLDMARENEINYMIQEMLVEEKVQERGVMPSESDMSSLIEEKIIELEEEESFNRESYTEEKLNEYAKILVLQNLLYEDVISEVEATESAVNMYYAANMENYAEGDMKMDITVIASNDSFEVQEAIDILNETEDLDVALEEIAGIVEEGFVQRIGWIDYSNYGMLDVAVMNEGKRLSEGTHSEVVVQGYSGGYYAVITHEKEESRIKSFSEVYDEAEEDYIEAEQAKVWNETFEGWFNEIEVKIGEEE